LTLVKLLVTCCFFMVGSALATLAGAAVLNDSLQLKQHWNWPDSY
jgi:hypothetical protein